MIRRSASRRGAGALLLIGMLVVAAALAFAGRVAAHAGVERSSPAANAVLAAPPATIELWAAEPVSDTPGSVQIAVLDADGRALDIQNLQVNPSDPRHVTAGVSNVGFGVFTVTWSLTSAVDGDTLSGAYGFRVGGSDRAPGAATVDGESPSSWAVATRWLTFLGGGIAAAGFSIGLLLARWTSASDSGNLRRVRLTAGAALIGLLATAAEPVLQSSFPPPGLAAPSVRQAFDVMPDAWLMRVAGLLLAVLFAAPFALGGRRPPAIVALAGAGAALVALLSLALTSQATARESWQAAAVAVAAIQQWSLALWAGGVIQLLVARPFDDESERPVSLQRFATIGIGLAAAGFIASAVDAGLTLPALGSALESDYGKVAAIELALLIPALALASLNRAMRARAASALRITTRLEGVLLSLAILGSSTLALLAPPPPVVDSSASVVDLAAEIPGMDGIFLRFLLTPAHGGENELSMVVTEGAPRFYDANNQLVDAPPAGDVELIQVALVNLLRESTPVTVELTPGADGWRRATNLQLGLNGWWRADVTVRRTGIPDAVTPFYFLLPDPNINGEDAPRQPETDPAAEAVYQTGYATLTSLNSVRYIERLSDGTGIVYYSDQTTLAGDGEQPAATRVASKTSEMVRMNGFQWIRSTGRDWIKTDANQVIPPSEWGVDYEGASNFQFAGQEMIGDRLAQRVTFSLPRTDRLAPAWYCWWVDVETGNLLRESMVSYGHYMIRNYDQFNSVPPISQPTD